MVLAAFTAAGCVDPGGTFDDFVERVPSRGAPGDGGTAEGGTCNVAPGSISGQYLLALSVTLAPAKPIVVLAQVDTPEADGATGISFSAQPLSAADRKTPVGDSLELGPFPVGQTGSFRGDLPGLQVTGAANSVTGGDIAADIVLEGSLCGDGSFFCGTLSGNVTDPLPLALAGSTFTMTRLDESGEIPTTPAIDCTGKLADPL